MSGWRCDDGVFINRGKPLSFSFDNTEMGGFAGDTIASALLASGESVIGRSFKYHRPRGLYGHGGEEPNAIIDVTMDGMTTPNVRATQMLLADGMALSSVNAGGSARRDRYRHLDWLAQFLPAGFYYKTFMAGGWMRWEGMIRRMAGLGRLDPAHLPPADIATRHLTCDLLVIGAGPAGLAAARAAADSGAMVCLADDGREAGGSMLWRGGEIDGAPWQAFRDETLAAIGRSGGIVLAGTVVWGAFDHGLFKAWQRREGKADLAWSIRPAETVLAAGAIERPLWFANNDLPGVMSSESALHYLRLYGAAAGRRVVVATGNDAAYATARAFLEAGAEAIVIDARRDVADADVEVVPGAQLQAAQGRGRVAAVDLADRRISTDAVLVSGGYTPSVHLFMQAGGKLDWNAGIDALVPRPGSAPMQVAGAANGAFDLAAVLAQGHVAGGGKGKPPRAESVPLRASHAMRPAGKGRRWIDFQNDVTIKDVELAAREGFVSVEHLKRYTTLGMATDQGRNSNFAGLAVMASITGRDIPQTGTTTYRPPFTPVPLAAIGGMRRGELFNPPKRLELEGLHRQAGARLREYGGWLRPACHGEGDELTQAGEEALAARTGVGLFDASPLGKIEVAGPDAAAIVDFCNYVRMSTLKPGRARYGFMLGENGIVHDDGVVLRLAPDRFIVSASSSHVGSVRLILEEARQDRFDAARAAIHDVTVNWVTLTVSGPRARDLLAAAGLPAELVGEGGLPPMGVAETIWQGTTLRVARVSFTGDMSFELSVPARHGAMLHGRLEKARQSVNGRWIGLEAVMILRAEKGYILIGKDTDGITMPHDLGWAGPRRKREDEYFGKRSLFTEEAERPDRRQLVGLRVAEGEAPLACGAHVVPLSGERRSQGFVTSSHASRFLGYPIALAQIEAGLSRMGERVGVFHLGETREAEIAPACAFDPQGGRLNG